MRRALAALGAVLLLAVSAPALAAPPGPPDAPEWWFADWDVTGLWAAGARGQGQTIVEIDSGVDAALPELRGKILPGHDFGVGGSGQTDRSVSVFGHGTAMASLMVARPGRFGIEGLAPDAKVLPLAVPLQGTTDAAVGDRVVAALRYAAAHHARIISMSLDAARVSGRGSCPADEQQAIYAALAAGALIFAAAGNSGVSAPPQEPGACRGVVAVGAVDRSGQVARFSSRHPYLSFGAPGVNVPTLARVHGKAFAGDGTSQATALAAAAAALVWSKYPALSARQVLTRMLATLDHRRSTPSPAYGYGVLDTGRAVRASVDPNGPNPVLDPVATEIGQHSAAVVSRSPAGVRPVPSTSDGHGRGALAIAAAVALVAVGGWAARRRRTRA